MSIPFYKFRVYKPNQADEIFMLPQTKNIAIVKEIMGNEKNYPISKKPIYFRGRLEMESLSLLFEQHLR